MDGHRATALSSSSQNEDVLRSGYYAAKQIYCENPVIAWSHRSRFEAALKIARGYSGRRLFDYGCGDGTFLAMAYRYFPDAVGAEVNSEQVADCEKRLNVMNGLSFTTIELLRSDERRHRFGLLFCMEVMEHCTEASLREVFADLHHLATADAKIIVSVPIEIGPTLIAKQLIRGAAGWRKLGDYAYGDKYRPWDFWRMVFAGPHSAIDRPLHQPEGAQGRFSSSYTHKGFNWRALRERLRQEFCVERTLFSPLNFFGGAFSSQAWFVCKPSD